MRRDGVFAEYQVSHGVALRFLGERVGAIRFDPGHAGHLLSINVTGVYRLQRRAHRLGVLVIGPAVHVACATGAVLLWAIVPGGPLQAFGFFAALIRYAAAALMLFPFVTSDGYYSVAALLDMPDLGRSALRLLRLAIRGPRWQRDAEIANLGTARTRALLLFAAGWWLARAAALAIMIWIVLHRLGR